jgi:hypothetical protein
MEVPGTTGWPLAGTVDALIDRVVFLRLKSKKELSKVGRIILNVPA